MSIPHVLLSLQVFLLLAKEEWGECNSNLKRNGAMNFSLNLVLKIYLYLIFN